jgi:hypothetical protein
MRLQAQIFLNIDASDFMEAAKHQSCLEKYLRDIQARYPDARLSIRERRQRKHDDAVPARSQARLRMIPG